MLVGAHISAAPNKVHYSRQRAIAKVNSTLASEVDAQLPRVPFGQWLATALRVNKVQWDLLVGCGDSNDARSGEVCVSVEVPVTRDVSVGVVIRFGTVARLEGPTVDLLFHERSDGSRYEEFSCLQELADFVRDVGPPPVP